MNHRNTAHWVREGIINTIFMALLLTASRASAENIYYKFHTPIDLVHSISKKLPTGAEITAKSIAYCPTTYSDGNCRIEITIKAWPSASSPGETLTPLIRSRFHECQNNACKTTRNGYDAISTIKIVQGERSVNIEVRNGEKK